MKYLISLLALLLLVSSVFSEEQTLTREQQLRIVEDFLYATGRAEQPSSRTAQGIIDDGYGDMPIKCGMSAVAEFVINKGRLDRDLRASLGIDELVPRAQLPEAYDSPSGHFKIHYARTGDDAVYRASEDSDHDGVPNYVEAVAIIADSVWHNIIEVMGYPVPPSDSFYTEEGLAPDATHPPAGGDGKFDIYLLDLGSAYYGLSYIDSINVDGPGGRRATSFMELDHDYQSLEGYQSRPLDAIRVTMAHEFFHAVQFGIDYSEAEPTDLPEFVRRYWMELSSTWMEEHLYDNINDYYGYLPFYFRDPTRSLQKFDNFVDLHPYASGIFGVFLDEKFGPEVIRETWLRCGEYGRGPHFLQALDVSIDSLTDGGWDIASAFAEFALWNYYTGGRASLAPSGHGYEEAELYPMIPDSAMIVDSSLAFSYGGNGRPAPQHMAASYFMHTNGLDVKDQVIVRGRFLTEDSLCQLAFVDTMFQPGFATTFDADIIKSVCADIDYTRDTCEFDAGCSDIRLARLDTAFTIELATAGLNRPWWVSVVHRLKETPDSHKVDVFPIASPECGSFYCASAVLPTDSPERFCSQMMIVSAASTDFLKYSPTTSMRLSYFIGEFRDSANWVPCGYDSNVVNVAPLVLYAYPNPAKLAEMDEPAVRLRFQLPTDANSRPMPEHTFISVDLFNIAGDRIGSISTTASREDWDLGDHNVLYDVIWDTRNSGGKEVASGVYLAYARMYTDASRSELLAESTVKVALIR